MGNLKFIKELLGKSSDIQDTLSLRTIELLELKLSIAKSELRIAEGENQLLNTRIERLTIRNEHLESALSEKITLNFN